MSVPARFVHVGFHFGGTVPVEKIESVFSTALDWLRYDPSCWILYTSTELNIWRDRLKKVPEISTGQFLLCEINAEPGTGYAGFMNKSTWEWMKKDR